MSNTYKAIRNYLSNKGYTTHYFRNLNEMCIPGELSNAGIAIKVTKCEVLVINTRVLQKTGIGMSIKEIHESQYKLNINDPTFFDQLLKIIKTIT